MAGSRTEANAQTHTNDKPSGGVMSSGSELPWNLERIDHIAAVDAVDHGIPDRRCTRQACHMHLGVIGVADPHANRNVAGKANRPVIAIVVGRACLNRGANIVGAQRRIRSIADAGVVMARISRITKAMRRSSTC